MVAVPRVRHRVNRFPVPCQLSVALSSVLSVFAGRCGVQAAIVVVVAIGNRRRRMLLDQLMYGSVLMMVMILFGVEVDSSEPGGIRALGERKPGEVRRRRTATAARYHPVVRVNVHDTERVQHGFLTIKQHSDLADPESCYHGVIVTALRYDADVQLSTTSGIRCFYFRSRRRVQSTSGAGVNQLVDGLSVV